MRRNAKQEQPPIRAAIYTRISRDSMIGGIAQAGVERQEVDCRTLADKLGLNVTKVFCDNDISAYSGKRRPGYDQLLEAITAGEVDAVVVWHTDRLYRRVSTLMDYIGVCQPRGVRTYAVMAGEIALDTPAGEATAVTIAAWSQYESAMKGKRQKSANAQRAQQGRHSSTGRVFGYESDGKFLRPIEADAIRNAYEAVIDGIPLAAICREWNDAGLYTSRKGRTWNGSLLSQLLRNPRYAGIKTYSPRGAGDKKVRGFQLLYAADGTPIHGKWEPVVDYDTWHAAQAVLTDPARKWAHPPQQLLAGIALCGVCGKVMHSGGTRRGGSGYQRRIRCSGSAGHAYRESAPIEAFVTKVVLEYLRRPDVADQLIDDSGSAAAAATIRQQLSDIQVRSDAFVALLADGAITPQQCRDGQARLRARRAALEAELPLPANTSLRRLIASQTPEDVWGELSDDERRIVIDELLTVEILPSGTKEAAYLDWRRRILNPDSIRLTWKHTKGE